MLKLAIAGLALSVVAMSGAQTSSMDRALNQKVSVHFREISVAGAMDFLAMHGINVAARTSDINIREQIALTVSSATMHDVMQAIAVALSARWTRSGNIFVLSRAGESPTPNAWQLAGPFARHGRQAQFHSGPDESAFQDLSDDTTPSAVVSDESGPSVRPGSIDSTKRSYLVKLTPDGEWAVAERWTSTSKTVAHALRPALSKRQKQVLSSRGYLSLADLTRTQVSSLGDAWPDGNYHGISHGKVIIVKP